MHNFVYIKIKGYMKEQRSMIIGVARHCFSIDGDGVITFVVFHGCQLRCCYCLNLQSLVDGDRFKEYTSGSLYDEVRTDELYFFYCQWWNVLGQRKIVFSPQFYSRVSIALIYSPTKCKH